jgi:hypothetical protein
LAQPPFPAELWLIVGKHLVNALSATKRWFSTYEPPEEAESGEFEIRMESEKPSEESLRK